MLPAEVALFLAKVLGRELRGASPGELKRAALGTVDASSARLVQGLASRQGPAPFQRLLWTLYRACPVEPELQTTLDAMRTHIEVHWPGGS